MANATEPAYRRSWTMTRNLRAERRSRQLVRQHDISGTPLVLVHQFSQLTVRADQLDRQLVAIQRRVARVTDMDADTFARWSFLVTEHRRCALAIATLAKSIFGEQHRPPEDDLVSMMARDVATDAETVVEADPPAEPPKGD
jgi:hypothetical protein